mmetsp:Transcript_4299/g.7544  ORF Transcript_4299/g.7544 Transcript_4299/m.7544 type:complete len:264 (-) Transcript_4299:768-1559(-)
MRYRTDLNLGNLSIVSLFSIQFLIYKKPFGLLFTTFVLILPPYLLSTTFTLPSLLSKTNNSIHSLAITLFSLLTLSTAFTLYFLFSTSFTDPGIIPNSINSPNSTNVSLQLMIESDGICYESEYCEICKHFIELRAHHCRVCDVCVSRFDHHCWFVSKCIGIRNQRYFLFFLFFALISLMFLLSFGLYDFILHNNQPVSLAVSIYGGASMCSIGGLFLFTLFICFWNITTFECVRINCLNSSFSVFSRFFHVESVKFIQFLSN